MTKTDNGVRDCVGKRRDVIEGQNACTEWINTMKWEVEQGSKVD